MTSTVSVDKISILMKFIEFISPKTENQQENGVFFLPCMKFVRLTEGALIRLSCVRCRESGMGENENT
jgi:hypothetical protein